MKNLNKMITASIIASLFIGNLNAQTKKATNQKASTKATTASVAATKTVAEPAKAAEPAKTIEPKKEVNDKPAVKTKKNYSGSQSSFVKGSKYLGGGASLSGGSMYINLSAEYGLTDDISLGGVVWLATGRSISGGLSANYCLSRVLHLTKFDPYVGATIAYQSGQVTSTDADGNRVDKNGITRVVAQAGVQYRMSPKTIFFAQYSVGILNGGAGWPSAGVKFSL